LKILLYILFFIFLPVLLLAQKPNLMLLKTYKDQNITNWVMSEKLDGIRAYWDGKKLLSRGGKTIYAPTWFTKDYPAFEIDGELWSKRGDFEFISSTVRDKVPDEKSWRDIKHYIFEVPNTKGGLFKRLEKVKPYVGNNIIIILQLHVKDKNHLKSFLKKVEENGGEGVVVRDPKAPYIAKRTSKVLKVKTFKDAECKVVAHTNGKGKFKEQLGALVCRLDNKTEFKIGSGFTDEQRKNPPSIGSIVTFKYKEFTKYGKPRFPIFLRIKRK